MTGIQPPEYPPITGKVSPARELEHWGRSESRRPPGMGFALAQHQTVPESEIEDGIDIRVETEL